MSEKALVDISQRWADVYRENESQRHLVSESDWSNWVTVRDKWNPLVTGLLESDREITEAEESRLNDLDRLISGAKHVPRSELERQNAPKVTDRDVKKRRGILELLTKKR